MFKLKHCEASTHQQGNTAWAEIMAVLSELKAQGSSALLWPCMIHAELRGFTVRTVFGGVVIYFLFFQITDEAENNLLDWLCLVTFFT